MSSATKFNYGRNSQANILRMIKSRSNKGQALAEGAAFLVLLIPVAIALILIILNIGFGVMTQEKLTCVATETARLVAGHRYFLGAECPGYQKQKDELCRQAKGRCNEMLRQMGLPEGDCKFDDSNKVSIKCTVTINVKLFGCGQFPHVTQCATGVVAQDAGGGMGDQNEHLIGRVALANADGSQRWVLYMPLYAAQKENGNWPNASGWTGGLQGQSAVPANRTVFITATQALNPGGPNGFRIIKDINGQRSTGGF